jgi:hypothetical protein
MNTDSKEKSVRKLRIASYFIQNSTIKCSVSEFEGLIQSLDFLEGFESPRDWILELRNCALASTMSLFAHS